MKHKKLILTILMTLCMTIVAGFGVYASIESTLSISGSLNFIALTKEVYINEIKISNYVDSNYNSQSTSIAGFNGKYLKNGATVDFGSQVNIVAGETAEIAITMTNLTSSYLRANLSYSRVESIDIRTTGLTMPINSAGTKDSGQAKTMKIYITNTSSGLINLSNLNLTVSFTSLGSRLIQSSGNYHYVEMGTIPNSAGTGAEYLKWGYIAESIGWAYTPSTTPPSGYGVFILDTVINQTRTDGTKILSCAYTNDMYYYDYSWDGGLGMDHQLNGWLNIGANDYATSTIRQYINGNKVYTNFNCTEVDCGCTDEDECSCDHDYIYTPKLSGNYSDMLTELCIDKENDIVYSLIETRQLSSMYSSDGKSFPTFDSGADVIDNKSQDKFWIASLKETEAMLSSQAQRFWGSGTTGQSYVCRSTAMGEYSISGYLDTIDQSGLAYESTTDYVQTCRPCFSLADIK